jgi:RAB protein geranylgeranyltransferase component A
MIIYKLTKCYFETEYDDLGLFRTEEGLLKKVRDTLVNKYISLVLINGTVYYKKEDKTYPLYEYIVDIIDTDKLED